MDLIRAFVAAGCIKLEKSTDKLATLMSKFRQQLKKVGMTPERAYKHYDEEDLRFVFKNSFVDISMAMGFDFTQDELLKVFQIICSQGNKKTDSND